MMDSLFARINKGFLSKPHGDKLRYRAGCRCLLCRAANARYESDRYRARKNGDWNGLVDARPARLRVRELARHGVGRRAYGVAESLIGQILSGKRKRIRSRTERQIMAVSPDARTDSSLVGAGRTLALIGELVERGYTKRQLAEWLGMKALRIGRRGKVSWRNAERVRKLAEDLNAGPIRMEWS